MSTEPPRTEDRRDPRIVARALVKSYGPTLALRGVDVTVRAREVTLIEGSNGSGKSTLLGIFGGVIRPTSGTVEYATGEGSSADGRRSIGWLSHDTGAYGDLTGELNVTQMARIHGMDGADAWERAQERFELGAFAKRPLRTCSRGQRQRIALARALVHAPLIVLLDEPTTGLDAAGVGRLVAVLDEETSRGAAVVVVSHDQGVFGGARRVKLERGRVVAASSPGAPAASA